MSLNVQTFTIYTALFNNSNLQSFGCFMELLYLSISETVTFTGPRETQQQLWPESQTTLPGETLRWWTALFTGSRLTSSPSTSPGVSRASTLRIIILTNPCCCCKAGTAYYFIIISIIIALSLMACQGSPVWLIPLGLADLEGLLAAVETQQIINFVLRIMETSHLILRKTSTPTKLNRHSFVFDLTGFRVTVRFLVS